MINDDSCTEACNLIVSVDVQNIIIIISSHNKITTKEK